jgi:hypothetical protein
MPLTVIGNVAICHVCPEVRWREPHEPCGAHPERSGWLPLAQAGTCPLRKFEGVIPGDESPMIPSELQADSLRLLWGELHGRPRVFQSASIEQLWLDDFGRRVPCGECRIGWQKILNETPPDLSSRAAYARWTWQAHNTVSRKLGKPEMGWDEAAKLYGWSG